MVSSIFMLTIFHLPLKSIIFQPARLLHPLATIKWEKFDYKYPECPKSCALLHGRIYINTSQGQVYSTTVDFVQWTKLPPIPVKIREFTLSTYLNKLVAVGGERDKTALKEVWVYDEGEWQMSLPPMLTGRRHAVAVNTGGSPECLVVTGGYYGAWYQVSNRSEVLVDMEWSYVESVVSENFMCNELNPTVCGDNLYISDGYDSVYCKLEALLEARSQTDNGRTFSGKLWKQLRFYCKHIPVGLGQRLFVCDARGESNRIFTFSTTSNRWVYVADAPFTNWCGGQRTFTIPSGEVVHLAIDIGRMLKGSIKRK